MKPLTLTIIKINLSWQLLVEVSQSQLDFQLIRQLPTTFSGTEFQGWTWPTGFMCSHSSTTFQHGHVGLVVRVRWGKRCLTGGPSGACSPEAHLMCTSRSSVWLHLRLTATPEPGRAQERTVLGGQLMPHSLDLQSVHSLLPGPLLLWRWRCLRVNHLWLDQILHPVLVSSKDWVWLSSLRY